MICGAFMEYSSVWLMPAVWIYIEFGKRERMMANERNRKTYKRNTRHRRTYE